MEAPRASTLASLVRSTRAIREVLASSQFRHTNWKTRLGKCGSGMGWSGAVGGSPERQRLRLRASGPR